MSRTESRSSDVNGTASVGSVDTKLEVIVIPVSDVDRAKEFYGRIGWRLDADRAVGDNFRLIQFTPPGSGCSVQFGTNLTSAEPGSAQALLLTVSDIEAAHDELVRRGVDVSEAYHCAAGTACRFRDGEGVFQRVSGPAPDRTSYSSFVSFSDPDGNSWYARYMADEAAGQIKGEGEASGE
jgi:predicted enzyme related to lactoylglutathione lyase